MRTAIAFILALAFLSGCASGPQPGSNPADVLGLASMDSTDRALLCHGYGHYLGC